MGFFLVGIIQEAVAVKVFQCFHLVASFDAGCFAFDCVYEEARDDFAVSGEVADVLL